jgi:hypothetical protein
MTNQIDLEKESPKVKEILELIIRAHKLFQELSREEQIRCNMLWDAALPN